MMFELQALSEEISQQKIGRKEYKHVPPSWLRTNG
jgi:hypothetical protein